MEKTISKGSSNELAGHPFLKFLVEFLVKIESNTCLQQLAQFFEVLGSEDRLLHSVIRLLNEEGLC